MDKEEAGLLGTIANLKLWSSRPPVRSMDSSNFRDPKPSDVWGLTDATIHQLKMALSATAQLGANAKRLGGSLDGSLGEPWGRRWHGDVFSWFFRPLALIVSWVLFGTTPIPSLQYVAFWGITEIHTVAFGIEWKTLLWRIFTKWVMACFRFFSKSMIFVFHNCSR